MREHVLPLWASLLVATAILLQPGHAAAQQSIMIYGVRPELHAGIGWHGEVGVGGRADIPIVPSGVIEGIDDELAISPGGELYLETDGDADVTVSALVAAQWNFYFQPEWSVFPEVGIALHIGDRGRRDDTDLRLGLLVGGGARYHWSSRNALVMRLCWPFGLQIGVTF